MAVRSLEVYNIVRLYRVSANTALRSGGLILRYVGQYGLITRIDEDKTLYGVRFKDGTSFWLTENSLRET